MPKFKYALGFLHTSNDFLVDVKENVSLATSIANYFSLPLNNFNFAFAEGQPKAKSYIFNEQNLRKLDSIETDKLRAISFNKLKSNRSHADTELTIAFSTAGYDDFPSKTFVFVDGQQLIKPLSYQCLGQITRQLMQVKQDLDYGFAMCMESDKMPMYYLAGFSTPGVTAEEEESVHAFTRNISQYRTKIWDIFWMNVINKRLITADMLKQITKIVSERNVIETGDKYIISLPVDPYEYMAYSRKTQSLKSKLRKIFREKDLIMYK